MPDRSVPTAQSAHASIAESDRRDNSRDRRHSRGECAAVSDIAPVAPEVFAKLEAPSVAVWCRATEQIMHGA
jgi:hypothetical protein